MSGNFTVVKKGYDTWEVDKYIENLEATLKSYTEKDSAIKNALINAQIAADNILKDAENNAVETQKGVIDKLEQIISSIGDQKRMVQEFQEDYAQLMAKYVHQVSDTDIMQLYNKINELEEYIAELQNGSHTSEED